MSFLYLINMSTTLPISKVMERRQVVVPADVAKEMGIKVGDKLVWVKVDDRLEVFKLRKPSLLNLANLGSAKKPTNAVELKKMIQRGEKPNDLH